MKKHIILSFLLIVFFLSPFRSQAEEYLDLKDALTGGTVHFDARLGFEYSSTDDFTSPAKGLNLRTRLGYETGSYLDTKLFLQFHSLANFLEEFRFPGGGDTRRDIIGDPDGERIHQAYVENNNLYGFDMMTIRIGRQEIVLDDARLIGNINWRQNGQSFDALSIKVNPMENLTLYAAFSDQVNTIFLTHQDLDFIILNTKYTFNENHHLTAFSYFLDHQSEVRDSLTFGTRLHGSCSDGWIKYDVTYAHQGNYQGSKNHNSDMVNAFLGAKLKMLDVGFGYSFLSGQDGTDRPFDTLFSTAHKFNGWADQFISTNGGGLVGGLEDLYVRLGTKMMDTEIAFLYHYFDNTEPIVSKNGSVHDSEYGDEFDIDLKRPITENLTAQLRAAFYRNGDSSGGANPTKDEDVFWARMIYSF